MSRTNRSLVTVVGLVLASGAAMADEHRGAYDSRYDRNGDYDYARVVNVQPLRRQVRVSEPVRECWQETTQASDGPFSYNNIGGTLIGGALGSVNCTATSAKFTSVVTSVTATAGKSGSMVTKSHTSTPDASTLRRCPTTRVSASRSVST